MFLVGWGSRGRGGQRQILALQFSRGEGVLASAIEASDGVNNNGGENETETAAPAAAIKNGGEKVGGEKETAAPAATE